MSEFLVENILPGVDDRDFFIAGIRRGEADKDLASRGWNSKDFLEEYFIWFDNRSYDDK